ncbi:MAG: Zn-ribbon domain-containing OB-fold protein [Candidatus Hydrothermarchaeales archaeon]
MTKSEGKYVAIKEGFFSKPLYPLDKSCLMGTRCGDCGEVFLGEIIACEQCQSENLESIPLSRTGKLYSYTINWNRPPGDYKGSEPFQPFAVGLVELPDGIRILSVLTDCDFDKLKVGMKLKLSMEELYEDEEGNTVITYKFRPQQAKPEAMA